MNARVQASKGATAWDVSVVMTALSRISCRPKEFKYRRQVQLLMSEPALAADEAMDIHPLTKDPFEILLMDEIKAVQVEIFEDFAQRVKDKDPVLMDLIRQFPIT